MNSDKFKLFFNDYIKGFVVFVIAAALTTLWGFASQADFNIFSADWGAIINQTLNVSFISALSYLIKNFLTGRSGKILGE